MEKQVNELALKQDALAEVLIKMFTNAKKDSKERKLSEGYLKKKREELDDAWSLFVKQHSSILALNCQDHKYIKKDFFAQVQERVGEYSAYLDEIANSIISSKSRELPTPPPASRTDGEPKYDNAYTLLNSPLVKKLMCKIARLHKLIDNTLAELPSEHSVKYWEFKHNSINNMWMTIQQAQEDVELQEDELATHGPFTDIEARVMDVMDRLCEKLSDDSPRCEKISLPRMDIPFFDGSYEKWTSFHDLFVALIHSNKNLGNVERMQFLKTRVKGEASNLLQHLNVSDSNYAVAWDILNNRYNNKRMLLFTHVNNIYSVPKVTNSPVMELKRIHDTIVENLRAINNLEINTESWDPLILYMLQGKLDNESLRLFEQSLSCPKEIPSLKDLLSFIETRFNSLEVLNNKSGKINNNLQTRSSNLVNSGKCAFCKEGHMIYSCKKFAEKTSKERFNFVKSRKLCINCLNHDSQSKCPSSKTCSKCNKKHHTLLHFESGAAPTNTENRDVTTNTVINLSNGVNRNSEVLLFTALIQMKTFEGRWETFRTLIDPGSQSSFITNEAAEALGTPKQRLCLSISGVGSSGTKITTRGKLNVEMKPRFPSEFRLRCELMVLQKLTTAIPSEDTEAIRRYNKLTLADPTYNRRGPIDVLLGADIYHSILKTGINKQGGSIAQNTEFGWIISGSATVECVSRDIRSMVVINEEPQLTRFWEMEELGERVPATPDDEQCEEFYRNTTKRNNGKYVVRLPFKESPTCLGNSKKQAVARLMQMERKFANNPQFASEYKQFMKEYEDMGHMVPVTGESKASYFIPHHAVCKEDSTTTKLRVVFDASAKSSSGKCLNELMFTGPKLQEDLSQILLRWRKHKFVLTADIEKMYRQIKIDLNDLPYQTIVWRNDVSEPVKEYHLTTVTYGTSSAPYLAIKTLQQLASDELENHAVASPVATRDYYVDDLLTGADSIEEARDLQRDMISLLSKGGFNLRKWKSNCMELVSALPEALQEKNFLEIGESDTKKMLGVHWAPRADKFRYCVRVEVDPQPTKRKILSQIAQLYDPLGWLAPIIVKAKLLIQELWQNDSGWDDVVSREISSCWTKFQSELKDVEKIGIPRWITYENTTTMELHGFCDASEKAYGAVIYCRSTNHYGQTTVTLLTAKSKVAPLKMKKTLPRLELCGAVLLAQLMRRSSETLDIPDLKLYAWSDSMITLAWIKGRPERWTTFVQNRVATINENVNPNAWNHVKSGDNPADMVSRGIDPSQLSSKSLWWSGPEWLPNWTSSSSSDNSTNFHTELESRKQLQVHHSVAQEEASFYTRFSSFRRLVRVIAYCHRFSNRCRKINNDGSLLLTTEELRVAHDSIIRVVQRKYYSSEVTALESKEDLAKSSKIVRLMPFMDEVGILRVGGRLQNSHMSYEEKHPIIIPREDHLASLLVRESHSKTLHGGNRLTLSTLRRKYWIPRGSSLVRHIVNKCVRCFRFRNASTTQLMGNLPECRVTICPPFSKSGLDYAGPIQIRMSKGRGAKSYKGFIAIFVCMVTKAIHLEAVSDMTSEAFLAAFKRFVSRRGHCSDIYSDNGTTFVGAKAVLEKDLSVAMQRTDFLQPLASEGTTWHFIPPGAPHFGGIWEAGVKSTKFHLKRVVGDATLTFEELTTVLCQIEACLNSRPLCVSLGEIPEEQITLTPSHFLIARGTSLQPDRVDADDDAKPTTRWRLLQKMKRDFWKVWSSEYIHSLQQRQKWFTPQPNIKEYDVVLVKDENLTPTKWPMARVTELHPGKDGRVRVVSVKTSNGNTYKRPITKLCPLPVDQHPDLTQTSRVSTRSSRSTNALTYMLFACLCITTLCAASPYTIKRPGPGIYIEHIGQAILHRGILKVEIPINITKFTEHDQLINSTLGQFKQICDQGRRFTIKCDLFLEELQHRYEELQLHMQIITNGYHSRVKRGLLGQFMTSVFGVNDEVYADIAALSDNQKQLIQSSNKQAAIMVKTLTSLNETERRISDKLNHFTAKLNEGMEHLRSIEFIHHAANANQIAIHILYIHQMAIALIDEVAARYNKLLKIIHHRGDILDFITIKEFHRLIANTTSQLSPKLMIITNHMIRMTMEQRVGEILVSAFYHIAEKSSFELMCVTPIPQRVKKNVFTSLKADSPLLAIDYNEQHYFELSDEELHQGIKIEDDKYLLSVDVIDDLNAEPNCVIDAVYGRTQSVTCSQHTFTISEVVWKRLYMLNTWLFVANASTRVDVECDGQRTDLWLNDTGILQVNQGCTIDTGRRTLKMQLTRTLQGVSAFHKPLNLSVPEIWQLPNLPKSLDREPIFKADEDLGSLLHDESLLAATINSTTWENVRPHVTTSAISVTVMILIGGTVLSAVWIIKKFNKSPPKPSFVLARQDVH